MWDFLLHPSEPDLVLGGQLEVETSVANGSVPVLRGVIVSLETEAIEGTGRGFNVTKGVRLHGSPLPAAGSLHPGFPRTVPRSCSNSPRGSSSSYRVLAAFSRGWPLVVLKPDKEEMVYCCLTVLLSYCLTVLLSFTF